ncbi:MAG: O-antigen ligase family protein [bacterium]
MRDSGPPVFVPRKAEIFLLTCTLFVCPLLFFTDLTRNPYYFQIVLLNCSVWLLVLLRMAEAFAPGGICLRRDALLAPWLAWLGVCLVSSCVSYFGHNSFFRPAIASEGARVGLFTLTNCFMVYMISSRIGWGRNDADRSVSGWILFLVVWSLLWLFFPALRGFSGESGIPAKFWDPYGGILWAAGFAAVFYLLRRGTHEDFLHAVFAVGALASVYGVLQYFQVELIWPKVLNPYGNRSVTTFGNPNFASSYAVMLVPLAVAYFLESRKASQRIFYGFLFFLYESFLLCSLTRSSWIGAGVALAVLFSVRACREKLVAQKKITAWLAAAALALVLLWPAGSLKNYRPIVLGRIGEAIFSVKGSSVAFPETGMRSYGSWHQRLLIWSSCWQMGLENPVSGKGWGMLELFYPWYQGPLLEKFPSMRNLRTHANNAHNEFLEIWSQTGLLGLGVFFWFCAVLIFWFRRFYRKAGEDDRFRSAPILAALAGMLTDNLLNVSLHFAVPAFLFWWLAGALSSRISPPQERVFRPVWLRPVLALAAAAALCGVGLWCAQFMRETHYFRGFKFMRRNDFFAAAKELKAAHDWNSREVNNNYELGNAYARTGDYRKADWAYGEALKANCGYDEIFFNAALIKGKKLGKWEESVKYLEMSLWINPLNHLSYVSIAEAFMQVPGRYDARGAEIMTRAVEIFPRDSNHANTLGYFKTRIGDYRAARQAYSRGLMLDPDNRMLEANLRKVLAQIGQNSDPALEWLGIYEELKARMARSDFSDSALNLARKAAEKNPLNLQSGIYVARMLMVRGDLAGAESSLRQVLAADYNLAAAHFGLAMILEKRGESQGARAELNEVLRIDPSNRPASEMLKSLS